jgi:hypothetical protein
MNAARPDFAFPDVYVTRKRRRVWELVLEEDTFSLVSRLSDRVEDK